MLSTWGSAAISGASRWLEALLIPAPGPARALVASATLITVRTAAVRAVELGRVERVLLRGAFIVWGARFRWGHGLPGMGPAIGRSGHCGPEPVESSGTRDGRTGGLTRSGQRLHPGGGSRPETSRPAPDTSTVVDLALEQLLGHSALVG
ncbi:hypothetical protein GCM10009760_35560 [Kitasatospora kazusensis]|uniref:Uncharacterized protein n=1 Tax=Kitasatospora kazusensis TaxID=407974 RepID=A0ABN2ZR72_9ACTN